MQRTTQVEKEIGTEDLVKMLRNGARVEIKDVKITGWNVKPHYEKKSGGNRSKKRSKKRGDARNA